ncbi:DMT family transporter [Aliidiomarina indica]|uniref:DMT family transporter n=1 Tax=Aliidiomarina indica TaxID=2749147 RepID=UPI00188E86A6|nr:DMT family transporter [Aliidiomarina indica]
MPLSRVLPLTTFAMLAFAANSLLCRAALLYTDIDAASFTTIRLVSGALVLWLIVQMRQGVQTGEGNWVSALALFVYAAGFSFAYMSLSAATGALLLFGAVQVTMMGYGFWAGERFRTLQMVGFALAFSGLVALLLPGLSAPPLFGSLLMLAAGVGWGIYSLRGSGGGDPVRVTAGNFLRAVPMAALVSIVMLGGMTMDLMGVVYAVASGALASGVGYALWYMALPALRATSAATVQLSVPVLTAIGGVILLSEPITWRLVLTSTAILGGVAMVIWTKQQRTSNPTARGT